MESFVIRLVPATALVLAFCFPCLAGQKPRKKAEPPLPICTIKTAIGSPCIWWGAEMLGREPSPEPPAAEALTPGPGQAEAETAAWAALAAERLRAGGFPSEFGVAAGDIATAWGRAQSFVAQHSSVKIQTITEYIIETYNPLHLGDYGFRIVKTPQGDGSFMIRVDCLAKSIELVQLYERLGRGGSRALDSKVRSDADAARNIERLAAYYIATGK